MLGAEYLGTTQIVVVETPDGVVKARIPADQHVAAGTIVGLALAGDRLSLFDRGSGRAIDTALYQGAHHG